jgi:hypothetical protein
MGSKILYSIKAGKITMRDRFLKILMDFLENFAKLFLGRPVLCLSSYLNGRVTLEVESIP